MSAFVRKQREGLLSRKERSTTVKKFKDDYEHLILVPLDNNLNSAMEDLFNRHPLRGFDAIHLASALVFTTSKETDLFFACFDHTLNKAANKEGLRVLEKTETDKRRKTFLNNGGKKSFACGFPLGYGMVTLDTATCVILGIRKFYLLYSRMPNK
ncbi:MAG: type II toxin-antitoxin system VapC family toxin [Planctomycetes bacterium]|nr:type II toxin-antitoxin system VapC family toxin [Planctomycetota bacterium]